MGSYATPPLSMEAGVMSYVFDTFRKKPVAVMVAWETADGKIDYESFPGIPSSTRGMIASLAEAYEPREMTEDTEQAEAD